MTQTNAQLRERIQGLIDQKIADYCSENGSWDPETNHTELSDDGEAYIAGLEDACSAILATISSADTGAPGPEIGKNPVRVEKLDSHLVTDASLASLVAEIDGLFKRGSTKQPWDNLHGTIRVQIDDDLCCPIFESRTPAELGKGRSYDKRFADAWRQEQNNAALIVALVNNWPRLRAALTTGGWLPIDSAPKDGTKVLCWTPEQSVCLYWCKHRGGWFEWADNEFCMFPTHWMPLPEPPTSKPDTGGG